MQREIANVAASCALQGFRYMAFPPIAFDPPPAEAEATPELPQGDVAGTIESPAQELPFATAEEVAAERSGRTEPVLEWPPEPDPEPVPEPLPPAVVVQAAPPPAVLAPPAPPLSPPPLPAAPPPAPLPAAPAPRPARDFALLDDISAEIRRHQNG